MADLTPEAVVIRLAETIAARAEFTEDDLYDALTSIGLSDLVADRAYKFTQIAWGRVFLDGLGIQFAPDYLCFNGAGDLIESGAIVDEPYFAAATALAPRYMGTPGFSRLALMSADVHAVNSLLNAGSQPSDIATSPAALFLEPATAEGLEKAKQTLLVRLSAGTAQDSSAPSANVQGDSGKRATAANDAPAPAPGKKPWWRLR